jgi:uncharacterized membrane protein YkvI
MEEEKNKGNWPLSNYPIFIALILLVATAVTLSMGDEHKAENFAIYAYYFLVLGVAIRFLEFTLPENMKSRVVKGIKSFRKKMWRT